MNESNLIPNSRRSKEELKQMGKKGGIASGEARRSKRDAMKKNEMLYNILDEQEKKQPGYIHQLVYRIIKNLYYL